MRFQSKYRNHKLIIKPTTRVIYPGQGSQIVPGIRVVFEGPQRIFDSEKAALRNGWDDETRELVEDFLLSHDEYGHGIYLAPGQQLPESKRTTARVVPEAQQRRCLQMAIVDGDLVQCDKPPSVGRDFCYEHDPDEAKVVKGVQTTAD